MAILVSREVLRHGRGNGLVARHDALHQTTHGLNTQRQGDHIQKQQITGRIVTSQLVGLDGGAQRHDFIGVQIVQRGTLKKLSHGRLHLGHAGGAAHHDDALNILHRQTGITHRLARSSNGASGQMGSNSLKLG